MLEHRKRDALERLREIAAAVQDVLPSEESLRARPPAASRPRQLAAGEQARAGLDVLHVAQRRRGRRAARPLDGGRARRCRPPARGRASRSGRSSGAGSARPRARSSPGRRRPAAAHAPLRASAAADPSPPRPSARSGPCATPRRRSRRAARAGTPVLPRRRREGAAETPRHRAGRAHASARPARRAGGFAFELSSLVDSATTVSSTSASMPARTLRHAIGRRFGGSLRRVCRPPARARELRSISERFCQGAPRGRDPTPERESQTGADLDSRTRAVVGSSRGWASREGEIDDTSTIYAAARGDGRAWACSSPRAFGRSRRAERARVARRCRSFAPPRPARKPQLVVRVHGGLGRPEHEARLRRPVPEQRAEHRGRPRRTRCT